MVSLWGSKKNGEEEEQALHETHAAPSHSHLRSSSQRDANERTRLLSGHSLPPPHANGHLDPDDPAVTPYNLWSVRFVRFLSLLFTAITFVWWVLLFVALFVTPPGLNTRGSGYTDFSFTTLTLGILLVSLLFFADPSSVMRISMFSLMILLLTDMIILLAIGRIRWEEGWVGIASIIWAVIISGWCVVTDRIVAWGKREEEERLTGRIETRRTLASWIGVLLASIILVVFIIIAVFLTATLALRAVDAGLAADGQRYSVDGDKYEVHLNCIGPEPKKNVDAHGNRLPTIMLEGGEEPLERSYDSWAYSAWNNGSIPRYCYWDRPGYAWSDNAPSPHSAGMSADALAEALAIKGETGPYISVSAGYGSIVARIWAARQAHNIVGMMLIDPMHEDLLLKVGNPTRGFRLWGWGILSPLGVERLFGAVFKGRSKEDRVWGNSVWSTGKFLKAKLQENLVAESFTSSEVSATKNLMKNENIPLVVVSSGVECGKSQQWKDKQEELTKLTGNLVGWDVVPGAKHDVWKLDDGEIRLKERLKQLAKIAEKRGKKE